MKTFLMKLIYNEKSLRKEIRIKTDEIHKNLGVPKDLMFEMGAKWMLDRIFNNKLES